MIASLFSTMGSSAGYVMGLERFGLEDGADRSAMVSEDFMDSNPDTVDAGLVH